ncbi:MAG: hypothetical protein DME15_04835 [Candidatus Rokuibacteriota bacterium]|nr:MAG: hypothetical protein DME15_04835 [Candidatus Rokubacteria bacterium]
MTVTIVADDLTGACDAGTLFAGKSPVPVAVWPDPPVAAPVSVVDTESRDLAAAEATRRVRRAIGPGARAGATVWFKKIDSTLRGHAGAELAALLRVTGLASALVCPAFPAQGRTVVDRQLFVNGEPRASVVDRLRPEVDRPLAWIPLGDVRAGGVALTARVMRLAGMVVVADAETDADLDALVGAALALEAPPLLAGSAGLARALAERLGLLAGPASLPTGRWLIVAGSLSPSTRRQIAEARRAGLRVLATPDAGRGDAATAAAEVGAEAARLLAAEPFDLVVVTGGETAVALYRALGATRLDLVGAPQPGLALGWLGMPGRADLAVLTKAGGFGPPNLFVSLAREAGA